MEAIYRNLDKLNPKFREKVELWLKEVWDEIFISESWRSQKRQQELYAQWRTTPWNIITRTLTSNHTKGVAVDIAFVWNELYPTNFDRWRNIADVAKKYGIDWWYDLWSRDKPHFQDNFIYSNKNKMTKYLQEFNDEVALGYTPLLITHEWDQTLSEWEIKNLLEVVWARIEKRIKDYIDNKFLNLKNSI